MQSISYHRWDILNSLLRPGDRIYVPGSAGEPTAFLEALAERGTAAAGVEMITSFLPGLNRFDLGAIHPDLRVTSFFPVAGVSTERVRLLPLSYYEIDGYLRRASLDLAVVQVSPPDATGRCSFGPWSEFAATAVAASRRTLAIINYRILPVADGPTAALSDFDFAVETDTPICSYRGGSDDPRAPVIAALVAGLIDDGATLQTGIGKLPTLVVEALSSRSDLTVRSGIILPAIRTLIESGAVRGKGSVVTASAMGDQDFQTWLAPRAEIRFAPVTETHDPTAIAACPRFTAINSALEVDLSGQCNAEAIAGRAVSGPGGLPDFTLAARRSPDGRSIVALPSTDAKRRFSRIVSQLDGGSVSISRHGVDFIVTEHGIADLRDRTAAERADALIAIADPAFRDALQAAR